jgi:hypothetical protein
MNRKIYSEKDLPEPINGVIYLEEGDEIKSVVDLGPNALELRPRDAVTSAIELNEDT